MHKRTAHRWRLLLVMTIVLVLALGTFWMAQVYDGGGPDLQADAARNEPDYIVEKFSFVRMSKEGKPRYLISGDKLTHRPVDDSADVLNPFVRSVGEDRPPTRIVAKTAHIDHHNTEVHLAGDVNIERQAGQERGMKLQTQALTIYSDEDQLKTDQPVRMETSDGSVVTGTGLFVDNAAQTLAIDSKVHMVIPPKQRPKK